MIKEKTLIDKFLQNYPIKSTNKSYRSAIKLFFSVIKKEPDTYFIEKQNYEEDVLTFWRHLNGHPPKTISGYISIIRTFLIENNIELPAKAWRGIRNRTKGNRAVTEDKIPTPEQVKRILSHADVRGRALFTVLLQSGMRIGELVKINLDDIDFSCKPTKIRIRAEITKSGNQRYCFIGQEATDSLKTYLEHRQAFLDTSINRARTLQKFYNREQLKNKDDSRVFPYDDGQIRSIWNRLLTYAKLGERDKRTNFHKMHPHVLRKFFRTHMSLTVQVDVVEALMGHEGYLTEVYRRYSIEQLGEQYLLGEKNISVFETTTDLSGINESLKEKDQEITNLQQQVEELMDFKTKYLENLILKHENQINGKKRKIP